MTFFFEVKRNLPHRILTTVACRARLVQIQLLLMFRRQSYEYCLEWQEQFPENVSRFMLFISFACADNPRRPLWVEG